jgi:hypothetical protein
MRLQGLGKLIRIRYPMCVCVCVFCFKHLVNIEAWCLYKA